LSEIQSSNGLGLLSDEVGQEGLKLLHLQCHLLIIQKPQILFHCRLKNLPSLLRVWTAL